MLRLLIPGPFAVDMTMQASVEPPTPDSLPVEPPSDEHTNVRDEERAFGSSAGANGTSYLSSAGQSTTAADETEIQTRASTTSAGGGSTTSNFVKRKTSQMLEAIRAQPKPDAPLPPRLVALVDAYSRSELAGALRAEIESVEAEQPTGVLDAANGEGNGELPDIALENSLTRGRKRASWATQFRILSGRAFKNLYRDPALLTAHYISSVVVARESFVPCSSPTVTHGRFSDLRVLLP